jgi:hypothetical protein
MLDSNAQTTLKAPDFNVGAVANAVNAYANPSIENVIKVGRTDKFDPLLGLHSMSESYSSPSTAKDFAKSALEGIGVAKTVGVV